MATRKIKLSPEAKAALEGQLQRFKQKFGREPKPHEPLFFDPDQPTPQPMDPQRVTEEIAELMKSAGVRPAIIYAFRKTGRMASNINWHLLSTKEKREWIKALEEYETTNGVANAAEAHAKSR